MENRIPHNMSPSGEYDFYWDNGQVPACLYTQTIHTVVMLND